MLSEKKLSNTLRIQIIEKIAEIDLPGFLFLEIDTALSLLNYFKLVNLHRNISVYSEFLDELALEYTNYILKKAEYPSYHRFSQTETAGFMTDSLMEKWVKLRLSYQELTKIESVYRVKCLLRMKEFINRRIYNQAKHTWVYNKRLDEKSSKSR